MACLWLQRFGLFSLLLTLVVFSQAYAAPVPEARVINDEPARFGDYEVYYSAFPSTFLEPDMAKMYGFERGPKTVWSISLSETSGTVKKARR